MAFLSSPVAGKLPFKINELQMTRINALRQLVDRREEMKRLA